MKSFISSFIQNVGVRFFLLREWVREIFHFVWRRPVFLLADISLVLSYFFKSPYRIVRQWDETHETPIGPYGELPISQMEKLFDILLFDKNIGSMADLGAGRGRIALWAAMRKGWQVQAIDCVPEFCQKLQKLVDRFHIKNLSVKEAEWFTSIPQLCDLVFINPGDLDLREGEKVRHALSHLKKGTYILTVGFSIPHPEGEFDVEGGMELSCPWGKEYAVLQRKSK